MMFDWKYFLSLAEALADTSKDEACWRSATSRAYYSAFHAARIYVSVHLGRDFNNQGENSHADLWKLLETKGNPDAKKAARIGKSLKLSRHQADYRAAAPLTSSMAMAAVEQAKKVPTYLADPSPDLSR